MGSHRCDLSDNTRQIWTEPIYSRMLCIGYLQGPTYVLAAGCNRHTNATMENELREYPFFLARQAAIQSRLRANVELVFVPSNPALRLSNGRAPRSCTICR